MHMNAHASSLAGPSQGMQHDGGCGKGGAGRSQVFAHMQAAAAGNPACAPNVITYSALMTACCAGGRPDRAYEVFQVSTKNLLP